MKMRKNGGLYIGRGGGKVSAIYGGFGWEGWMDVSGEEMMGKKD